jgi:PAS domain S-box-containing protein
MSYHLTPQEQQLLEALISGYSQREICHRLSISALEIDQIWERVHEEMESADAETPADIELREGYHRVERRHLEAELWASEARLNALMDTAPEAILVIDGRSGKIQRINNQALLLLGYTLREMIGASMEILVPEELRDIHVSYRLGFLNSVRKRELGYHPLIQGVCKDGRLVNLDIALTATAATDDVMVVCRVASEAALPSSQQSAQA